MYYYFLSTVKRQPNDVAYIFEGKQWTWAQADVGGYMCLAAARGCATFLSSSPNGYGDVNSTLNGWPQGFCVDYMLICRRPMRPSLHLI